MANRAYLRGWDPRTGEQKSPELEGCKYSLPLLWHLMFDPGDLHDVTLDGDRFVKPVFPKGELATYLSCAGAQAHERLAERVPSVVVDTQFADLGTKFVRFMKKFTDRWILLETSEIGRMSDPGVFAREMGASLELVAGASTAKARLAALHASVRELDNDPNNDDLLIGGFSGLTKQDRESAKRRKDGGQASRADTKRNTAFQTGIDRVPPDQRKPYRASGVFEINDVIEHAKFGPGVVLHAIDTKKIEVLFADGPHTLVHRLP